MARPQSGVLPAPLQYNRIQTLEVHDLPMTSMTVGQFSVMIPGLAHQLAHAMPQEAFKVTVAFGFMFWTLAWHGKSPRMFRPFEELEAGEQVIAEGEGDLWVHYSATRPELITRLIRKVDENIGSLVRVLDDFDVFHDKGSENPEPVSPEIWIPDNEPDFSRGTLLTHLHVDHDPGYRCGLYRLLEEKLRLRGLGEQVLLRYFLPFGGGAQGSLVHLFHRDSASLDQFLESFLEDDSGLEWGEDRVRSMRASRFFVPSLDVLTGLRQGGIRMNRFSQTQQWKD